ncbi:polynucleotide adenylyltransferase PcnB [Comamonas kerstersii]|uniref:Poly(A) polymerase I n=1 Tax=Comamonas kerstersii TaxID=225992 RepID=A0A1V0BF95_9BURK|nr:polynucleotide adenylyltransferase PcnB [Comamonas kerstersii]AQZ98521.1 polynucleotide adenylyltransferase PcnB [Comamonas kerstersii]MDO4969669.1 polynucleotide adenylyltransferase PcnB [Comamonadaceae bacterium]HBW62103.1 polynucleotide adenylyltransferase PcnB [Comamonas kerstersii]
MIKTIIDKLLGKPSAAKTRKSPFGKREEVPASVHGIDPQLVDHRAVDVVRTLKDAGYEAYIVGGAVRDLLLGLRPKDFDVATNATPEQVKSLFRRAFIIGKRFRIVHVVYGRGREHEVIEVSTFRAFLDNSQAEQVTGNERTSKLALAHMKHAVDANGRVLRDNVWGPQDQDATRRDFTVNAMYYDPESQIVVDFHKGIQDAQKRVLRMIGDPATRYREDPVRIIRAVRFAAKLSPLGFKLDAKTAKPLVECEHLLEEVPQSRLFDEMLKLLQTGHALASIEQLKKLGLSKGIYPLLDVVVERADEPFVRAVLADTDRRVGEGKPVAPSFMLACVLWQDVKSGWGRRLKKGYNVFPALSEAIDEVFDQRIGDVSGRGKLAADMREIWVMQPRFDKRTGSSPLGMVMQQRFRAGFDFLRLRADVGEVDEALAQWWQDFQMADDALREDLIAQAREEQRQKQKAAQPRKTVRTAQTGEASALENLVAEGDAPAKKKRRRRRKPAGAGGAASAAGKAEA